MYVKIHFISLLIFLFLLVFSSAGITYAETVQLTGKAFGKSNNPLSNTKLTITDSSTQRVVAAGMTDPVGNYNFPLPPGTYNITATAPAGSDLSGQTTYGVKVTDNSVQNLTFSSSTANSLSQASSSQETGGMKALSGFLYLNILAVLIILCIAVFGYVKWKKQVKKTAAKA